MKLEGKGNRHWQEFTSVSDTLDFITNDKFIQKESNTSSGANPGSWGHKNFLETVRMMQDGWPEGRDEIEKFVILIEKRVMGHLPVVEVVRDVTGEWLDMGAYVAGEPEAWASFQDTDVYMEKRGPKIIHVVLNVDVTWEPFKRGAAGVAIIDALERVGYRVIADAIANTVKNNRLLETCIRVKNSDEPVQLDKLAFLFAHPNILAHVLFACWERLPTPIRAMYGFTNHYGYVGNVPKEDQGDLYVNRNVGNVGDIDEVAKYVLKQIASQGVRIREEA
mgnify:CR=1 FL=1